MQTWLVHHRARVAAKSPLGEALAYIAKYWNGLKLFLTDGRIEIDNNSVERTIRPIAPNRKNALFAGHDAGAENWATIASLIETCDSGLLTALSQLRGQHLSNPAPILLLELAVMSHLFDGLRHPQLDDKSPTQLKGSLILSCPSRWSVSVLVHRSSLFRFQ